MTTAYEGKVVVIEGKIKVYEGSPEIVLNTPSQIELAAEGDK
jgi:DNA/RNA endonuclease YhcR with UshA esterase domain